MNALESLAVPHVAEMQGYVPGEQPQDSGWAKLNTNENPYPPSPKVFEVLQSELTNSPQRLRKYPQPISLPLRRAIAAYHGLDASQVIVGNGCDDVLNLLLRVFCGPGRAAGMTVPSYSLYDVLRRIQGAEMREVPFERSMQLDPEAVVNSGAHLFFLTSPNSPTGIGYSPDLVAQIMERFSGIFVVDETYAPFASSDCVALLARYPRLVVTRSFSKAYSLAGLRVGYGLASPEVIELLDRVRDSYNVNHLSQLAAQAALEDTAYASQTIDRIIRAREETAAWYESMGWFVYPSQSNFHFVEPTDAKGQAGPEIARSLFLHLKSERVLVRYFDKSPLTASFLRVSVGHPDEMAQLREAVGRWRAG